MTEEITKLRETVQNLAVQVARLTQAVEAKAVILSETKNPLLAVDQQDQDLLYHRGAKNAITLRRQPRDLVVALLNRTVRTRKRPA